MDLFEAHDAIARIRELQKKEREHMEKLAIHADKYPHDAWIIESFNESRKNHLHYKTRAKQYEEHFFEKHQLPRVCTK